MTHENGNEGTPASLLCRLAGEYVLSALLAYREACPDAYRALAAELGGSLDGLMVCVSLGTEEHGLSVSRVTDQGVRLVTSQTVRRVPRPAESLN